MSQQKPAKEFTLTEEESSILSALKGRTLNCISARQFMVETNYTWGDTICLFLSGPFDRRPWDPVDSFVTFTFEDSYSDDGDRVISVLHVHQGIAASEIPFDNEFKAPGPCSSIYDKLRDFRIRELSVIKASLPQTTEPPHHNVAPEIALSAEAGVLFVSEEGRKFAILAEQTGDIHYIPEHAVENLFRSPAADQINGYVLSVSRKL